MPQILVVEDDPATRTALRHLLERHSYAVSEAVSISEAVSSFRSGDFDLIISNLRLPGAQGTDLIGKAGGLPVLIMSNHASLRSAVECMRMGAADYIAKPFDHNDMIAAIQRIVAAGGGRNQATLPEDLSLEDYFRCFVLKHQDSMNETELAQKLGITRKCLWERRQRLGIPRKKAACDKMPVSSQEQIH